ncbi:retrovirus-related pol polyprotein from transposon RE1 [Tanacetum coccineum]
MIALNAKNMMKIVTGEFIEPTMDYCLRPLWERNNDMLNSWILSILKGFWDEFDALEAPDMCIRTCRYSNAKGHILLMQALPSLAKAYTMATQEEKQKEGLIAKPEKWLIQTLLLRGEALLERVFNMEIIGKKDTSKKNATRLRTQNRKSHPLTHKQQLKPVIFMCLQRWNSRGINSIKSFSCYKIIRAISLKDQNKRIAHGTLCDGLYFISLTPTSLNQSYVILHNNTNPSLWHSRLGHSSFTVLKKIKWVETMHKEIQALESNCTWDITLLSLSKTPIGYKWMYRVKFKAGGLVERFKARLVAKGFNQKEDIDYKETFAPASKMVSANMQWFIKLTTFLTTLRFYQSYTDTSLFTLTKGTSFTTLLIYVDDILLTGNDKAMIQSIKHQLDTKFSIKDLRSLHYYLGIEIL